MIEELENGNTEQFSDVMSSWLPPCNGKSLVKMTYDNVDGTCQYGFRPLVKGEFEPFEASCQDEPGQLVDGTMRSVYKSTGRFVKCVGQWEPHSSD